MLRNERVNIAEIPWLRDGIVVSPIGELLPYFRLRPTYPEQLSHMPGPGDFESVNVPHPGIYVFVQMQCLRYDFVLEAAEEEHRNAGNLGQ